MYVSGTLGPALRLLQLLFVIVDQLDGHLRASVLLKTRA